MIENGDFRFRDDLTKTKNGDTVAIEILTPPYNNVIFRYTKVALKEQDNGTGVLQFAYELLDLGKDSSHSHSSLRRDPRFEEHLGILLNHLILEVAENDVADREDYSEEPDAQRGVHS